MKIDLTVDGTRYEDDVEPRTLLVQHLRETLGLTGVNIGCDTSNCGACTIHLDGHSVKSCTVLAVQADGCEVTTIHGLAEDETDAGHAGIRCSRPSTPSTACSAGTAPRA